MRHTRINVARIALTLLILAALPAHAETIEVQYVRTIDGDTIVVNIPQWPDIVGRNIPVRIRGCDTPELHDPRPAIRLLAQNAKKFTTGLMESARSIQLVNPTRGKYFRLLSRVVIDGQDLTTILLRSRLALPCGASRASW